MTTKTAPTFSLDNLKVFERSEVKKITARDEPGRAGCYVDFENGWRLSIQWNERS